MCFLKCVLWSHFCSACYIIFLFYLPTFCNAISPVNPFLVSSPWSIAQHDNYAQGSTELPGPETVGQVDSLFGIEVAGALTILYSADGKVMWGSSLTSVFKVDRGAQNGSPMKLIDSMAKPASARQKDTFRGIYSVLTKDGTFIIATGDLVSGYCDVDPTQPLKSKIKHVKTFDFGPHAWKGERVLAVNLTYDGKLVLVTSKGRIGILSLDLSKLIALKNATHDSVSVTNSVAVDEYGGIYLVTSKYIHRMYWSALRQMLYGVPPPVDSKDGKVKGIVVSACQGNEEKTIKDFCQIWSMPYAVSDGPIEGRPTKEGSGTTPSLMKLNQKLYVLIADGQRKQEVLAIDATNGETVSTAPVEFESSKESYTEQSILVYGSKLLITQNALTSRGQRINDLLKSINAKDVVSSVPVPEFVRDNVDLVPVVLGDDPRGFQQFELVENGPENRPQLRKTWTRSDVGCPNAIPTMSGKSGIIYCVGKKIALLPGMLIQGSWTIEAVDWHTGESVFSAAMGSNILFNSLYAATQIGPDEEIVYGSIGGLVRMRSECSSSLLRATVGHIVSGRFIAKERCWLRKEGNAASRMVENGVKTLMNVVNFNE